VGGKESGENVSVNAVRGRREDRTEEGEDKGVGFYAAERVARPYWKRFELDYSKQSGSPRVRLAGRKKTPRQIVLLDQGVC